MARAKICLFSEAEKYGAQIGLAFGHPARIRIVELLRNKRVVSYSELMASIPLAGSTICQHVQILNRAGLIETALLETGEAGYKLGDAAREGALEVMMGLLAA